jgi:hypothetical protein
MDQALPIVRLSFRVHLIRIHGPEVEPTVRGLLVETTNALAVYEGFGRWSQWKLWIGQISESVIQRDKLAAAHKRLDQNKMATIEVRATLDDLDSVGLRRADTSTVEPVL